MRFFNIGLQALREVWVHVEGRGARGQWVAALKAEVPRLLPAAVQLTWGQRWQ